MILVEKSIPVVLGLYLVVLSLLGVGLALVGGAGVTISDMSTSVTGASKLLSTHP